MHKLNYKYDVAISFSEAQKDVASGIYVALEKLNIRPYYYPYNEEENAGANLKDNLIKFFESSAKLSIAIISEEYLVSDYARLELEVILKRLEREPNCFIPIIYKEVELPNSIKDLAYLKWKSDPKAIADTISKRLSKKNDTRHLPKIMEAPNVIKIERIKHESFLADHRTDPISKGLIKAGDEVVVCKSCKTVFFKDIWIIALKGMHCNQTKTLRSLPVVNLDDAKAIVRRINQMASYIGFELNINSQNPVFNKVILGADRLIFKLQEKSLKIITVVVHLGLLNKKNCKLVYRSNREAALLMESMTGKDAIFLNATPQGKIGFVLSFNGENLTMFKQFNSLIIRLINKV
ncbi:toll/interleukin-1 receptor domain-containing protein [uncultured Psychroserpens sp.]|uniref:toll/interleukin-1 receptor domain-containing protein n=1 Tax=uncultured Psychroserpens sp. TaxID=255436 RepID=UPI002614E9A0|nr:toll/interleukin-1 receptor domain-containing protein [uncultured Psychroserpens sp.]